MYYDATGDDYCNTCHADSWAEVLEQARDDLECDAREWSRQDENFTGIVVAVTVREWKCEADSYWDSGRDPIREKTLTFELKA